MYKGRFFRFILRILDWLNFRSQEIYFSLMAIVIAGGIGFGVYLYIYYMKYPMFPNPQSIVEHFARPIIIGLLGAVLIISFGLFLSHLVTMIPFRRIKVFKMEIEFESSTKKERQVANQFLYSSTMLHNHTENVRFLTANGFSDLKEILEFLAISYQNNIREYNNELTLDIDIVEPSELEGRVERNLFKLIDDQQINKTSTIYRNRIIKRENILVGVCSDPEENKVVTVVKRDYNNPFDIYDQETMEVIFGYAMILYDMITLIDVLKEEIGNEK